MSNQSLTVVDGATKADLALIEGDLSKLSGAERLTYYMNVCKSVGLNPSTKPFQYIILNGKLTLYATKGAADQLRDIHGVSIQKPDMQITDGLCIVSVFGSDRTGRTDADLGIVPVEGLRGEAKANALMKAITKAKRRLTLSICGLGMLDETEVTSIPDAKPVNVDMETGEIYPGEENGGTAGNSAKPSRPVPPTVSLAEANPPLQQDDAKEAESRAKAARKALFEKAKTFGFKGTTAAQRNDLVIALSGGEVESWDEACYVAAFRASDGWFKNCVNEINATIEDPPLIPAEAPEKAQDRTVEAMTR